MSPEPGSPAVLTHRPCLISTCQHSSCFITAINTFCLQGPNTCRKLTDSVAAMDSQVLAIERIRSLGD